MPSHVPRTDTQKKQIQVGRRERQLEHAIRHELTGERLVRLVEAVRVAQLSLLKAELYWAARSSGRDVTARRRNIQRKAEQWKLRPVDEILADYVRQVRSEDYNPELNGEVERQS